MRIDVDRVEVDARAAAIQQAAWEIDHGAVTRWLRAVGEAVPDGRTAESAAGLARSVGFDAIRLRDSLAEHARLLAAAAASYAATDESTVPAAR